MFYVIVTELLCDECKELGGSAMSNHEAKQDALDLALDAGFKKIFNENNKWVCLCPECYAKRRARRAAKAAPQREAK